MMSSAHQSGQKQCFRCSAVETPAWRRDLEGRLVCNACGLYRKLTKQKRPEHLFKKATTPRKRKAFKRSSLPHSPCVHTDQDTIAIKTSSEEPYDQEKSDLSESSGSSTSSEVPQSSGAPRTYGNPPVRLTSIPLEWRERSSGPRPTAVVKAMVEYHKIDPSLSDKYPITMEELENCRNVMKCYRRPKC